jgi:hypothetical protein
VICTIFVEYVLSVAQPAVFFQHLPGHQRSSHLRGWHVVLELIVVSTLNGVLYGMLLFLMASGLTVIFSMLVLNFAHASF